VFAHRGKDGEIRQVGEERSSTPVSSPRCTLAAAPTTTQPPLETDKTIQLVPPSVPAESTSSSILGAVASPAVVSGIGNTVFVATLNNQYVTLFYACIAGLSFLNELRTTSVGASSPGDTQEGTPSQANRRGFLGFMREQLRLPGICLAIDGVAFLGTGLGYLIANGVSPDTAIKMVVFGAFSIASFAGARLSNQGVQREPREPWWLERNVHSLWSCIPRGMQAYLQNPGAVFATGNLPNYTTALFATLSAVESVSLAHKVAIGLAAGCTFTAAALGVLPFLGKLSGWHKAAPCIVNGAGNFLFGGLLFHASINSQAIHPALVGCAAIAWGFGNVGLAIRIARDKG
jgi:hypothetical protein